MKSRGMSREGKDVRVEERSEEGKGREEKNLKDQGVMSGSNDGREMRQKRRMKKLGGDVRNDRREGKTEEKGSKGRRFTAAPPRSGARSGALGRYKRGNKDKVGRKLTSGD